MSCGGSRPGEAFQSGDRRCLARITAPSMMPRGCGGKLGGRKRSESHAHALLSGALTMLHSIARDLRVKDSVTLLSSVPGSS